MINFAKPDFDPAIKNDNLAPRLVVPGDSLGGRYVSDVVRLRLVDA